ncbi:MAG: hypothetical protein L0H93_15415 [Nocardioides sp.]|nr:hypothetical protein [Nocardioides sp.]
MSTQSHTQAHAGRAIDGWVVRVPVTRLRAGQRFYFDDEFGGEGDVVTVESQHSSFGTVEVWTAEYDFGLEFMQEQLVTMAADEQEA